MSQIPRPNDSGSGSRLSRMQAQFQQKQMQEKEAKLLQMLDSQQQRVIEKANGVLNKYSANNNNNHYGGSSSHSLLNGNSSPANIPPGRVRQMFEERRKGGGNINGSSAPSTLSNGHSNRNGGLTGIDKSYPLEPIITPPTKSRSGSSRSNPMMSPSPAPPKRSTAAPLIKPSNLGSSNKPPREISGGPPARKEPLAAVASGGGARTGGAVTPARSTRVTPTPTKSLGGGRSSVAERTASPEYSPLSSPSPVPENEGLYPPVANTTKYSDYANELEKREATLANKLKGLDLGGGAGPSSRGMSPSSASQNRVKPPPTKTGMTLSSGSGSKSTATTKTAPKTFGTSVKKDVGIKKMTSPIIKPRKSSAGPPPGHDECKMCGRFFASDRIAKHESICKKVATKKRKVFDPTKMRMQGTEAEPYIRIVSGKVKKPAAAVVQPQAKKVDWRKKHEDFIKTIRAAKEYQAHVARGGDPADLPPPPPSDNSDYIQCPHCNRKFSEGAAERHIPKCKNIKSNKRK